MVARGRAEKEPVRKRNRNKIDGMRQKLHAPEISGYQTRWVNDYTGRIQSLTEHDDYSFVSKSEISDPMGRAEVGDPNVTPELQVGDRVARIVGADGGSPVYAYLMKKRKEFFLQDQAEKEKELLEVETQLKRGREDAAMFSHGNVEISRRGAT